MIVFATNANTYEERLIVAPPTGSHFKATVIGVGTGSTGSEIRPTIEFSSADPVIDVTLGTAASIDLNLDNFWIDVYPGSYDAGGVRCQGAPDDRGATHLTLTRSTVYGGGFGVRASNCDLVFERDAMWGTELGIGLEDSDFTLRNLLVLNFGTPAWMSTFATGGILATGTSTRAILVNSSIFSHYTRAPIFGVVCVPGMTLLNNVVFGSDGGGAIDLTTCSPSYSSFSGAGSENHNQDLTTCGADSLALQKALFVDSPNAVFHPKTGGSAPCTLVGLGTPTGAPSDTFDGQPRPASPAIGCYEP